MAQDYIILGFSADKWNVYKAELEHDFSADMDKLEISSHYVTDGNEHHGIGSAGVQKIISLTRMLKCKETWGKAESYLDETEEGRERIRGYFSSVKGTEDDFIEVNRALFERQMLNDIVKCAQSKEDLDPKYPSPDLKKRGEAIKQVYEKHMEDRCCRC